MIDKVELSNQIYEAANLCLADIYNMSEDTLKENLRYFAEKSKKIAEYILEQFVFDNFAKYTEGIFAITDPVVHEKFCDFKIGYQQQMLNWISDHPLEVKEETFHVPQKPDISAKDSAISPKTIIVGGTILSVGLFVFTNVWIFIGAELLAVVLAKIQSMRIQKSESQRRESMEYYKISLENKKNELVNGMINELDKWLDLGEEKSNEILASYNL